MSDCSKQAWHVPEQREPGVLYMHGLPGTDYAAVQAIEVDGQRFEQVRECENVGNPRDFACSVCGARLYTENNDGYTMCLEDCQTIIKSPNFCPHCGAKV